MKKAHSLSFRQKNKSPPHRATMSPPPLHQLPSPSSRLTRLVSCDSIDMVAGPRTGSCVVLHVPATTTIFHFHGDNDVSFHSLNRSQNDQPAIVTISPAPRKKTLVVQGSQPSPMNVSPRNIEERFHKQPAAAIALSRPPPVKQEEGMARPPWPCMKNQLEVYMDKSEGSQKRINIHMMDFTRHMVKVPPAKMSEFTPSSAETHTKNAGAAVNTTGIMKSRAGTSVRLFRLRSAMNSSRQTRRQLQSLVQGRPRQQLYQKVQLPTKKQGRRTAKSAFLNRTGVSGRSLVQLLRNLDRK